MRRFVVFAAIACLCVGGVLSRAGSGGSTASLALAADDASGGEKRVSVLVHLEAGANRGPLRRFARERGGRVRHEYALLPRVVNLRDIPESSLDELERVPGVMRVEPDAEVKLHLNQSAPLIHALQPEIAAAGFTADGSGVRVCVVDTGVNPNHVMFPGRIDLLASYDVVNDDPDPDDVFGHGSHVMGIAIGGTDVYADYGDPGCSEEQIPGVAPLATGIAQKVFSDAGTATLSDVVAGIQNCTDPSLPNGPADVVNLSLGGGAFSGTCDGDTLAAAANAAVDAGAVVVASSGNEGRSNALASPACGSKVISAGAVYDAVYPTCDFAVDSFTWCLEGNFFFCTKTCTDDQPATDELACFSNRSANLDVVAPGCVIWSAEPSADNSIAPNCGTSMAAPHV
ncbi:MAG: S8 family peptidase, partial [Candidatus Binatia bacterium]